MEENRCIICGKILHDPLAVYCAECEYELKRVRLEDDESLEEWMSKMANENLGTVQTDLEHIKMLDNWL